jgi:hypothetical protein
MVGLPACYASAAARYGVPGGSSAASIELLRGDPMVIATRLLQLRTGTSSQQFAARLFKPEERDGRWLCRYEIDWPKGRKVSSATSSDSVQSIVAALQKIGIELYTSDCHRAGHLTWHAPRKGYGFPVTANVRDLLQGDDAHL